MRKKNYKGAKCTKRTIPKCEGICKTYDSIQYLQNVADIIVKSPVKLSIKEMARATKVDETKLRYQVAKREKLS